MKTQKKSSATNLLGVLQPFHELRVFFGGVGSPPALPAWASPASSPCVAWPPPTRWPTVRGIHPAPGNPQAALGHVAGPGGSRWCWELKCNGCQRRWWTWTSFARGRRTKEKTQDTEREKKVLKSWAKIGDCMDHLHTQKSFFLYEDLRVVLWDLPEIRWNSLFKSILNRALSIL